VKKAKQAELPPQRVRLDLNSPSFLEVFLRLERQELAQVAKALDRLRNLEWNNAYQGSGFNWEAIERLKAPDGATTIYSIRLSQKIRALVYRDGEFMRFISLHPDHDSAYQ
jgi:hypothetical protein